MVKLLLINITINFNECSYELNELYAKIENLQETPFCMIEHQIKNPGKLHNLIVKYPEKFTYEVLSNLVQELWRWTDEWTDKAATACSPFGEHNNVR